MTYVEFELKTSPFQKLNEFKPAKTGERVSVRTDIAPEDYELVEEYIRKRDPNFDPKKKKNDFDNSKFVRELIKNFLNNSAFEKKSIDDIYFILLLPKDPEEMACEGEIVGVIQDENAFYTDNPYSYYKGKRNKFNFIFYLEEFNERNYNDLLMLYHGEDALFFNVSKDIQNDFFKVITRFEEIGYETIGLDDCYFTIINANNYLDVLNKGQYTHRGSNLFHEGVIVLYDALNYLKVCMTCQWSLHHGLMDLSLDVEDEGEFNETIIYEVDNEDIINAYYGITSILSREGALERRIKDRNELIQQLEHMNDEDERRLQEIQKNK